MTKPTNELAWQTIALVGASSGIGLATARAAASQNAHVIMISRSPTNLKETAKSVQGNPRLVAWDMLDRGVVNHVIASIVRFGKALALELAPVRVNVVMPGAVDTPLHGNQREGVKVWAESLLAGRFGQPEDVAKAILFLIPNAKINFRNGKRTEMEGGKSPMKVGDRKSHSFGEKKTH
jgi:NAD(P)-dependent dehydrogenase (short-subunit alcohol dehydrogenase family)